MPLNRELFLRNRELEIAIRELHPNRILVLAAAPAFSLYSRDVLIVAGHFCPVLTGLSAHQLNGTNPYESPYFPFLTLVYEWMKPKYDARLRLLESQIQTLHDWGDASRIHLTNFGSHLSA